MVRDGRPGRVGWKTPERWLQGSVVTFDMRGNERIWSSDEGSMEDASELSGEEGRGKLRKVTGRSKHPLIRESPNGVTRLGESPVTVH